MQVFLAWRKPAALPHALPSAAQVGARLLAHFAPLFNERPTLRIFEQPAWALAYLELPVAGWTTPFLQQRGPRWALSIDYPINCPDVTGPQPTDQELLTVVELSEQNPDSTLATLNPPFTLIWPDTHQPHLHLINDGLGFCPLLQYRCAHGLFACSNRPLAFQALGLPLDLDPMEWAVKSNLGWITQEATGFKQVKVAPPGTHIVISVEGVQITRHDVLGRWLGEGPRPQAECLELATESMRNYIRAAARHWSAASAGMTGGRDSRAIAALLIHEGVGGFYFRTRGLRTSGDVMVAHRLLKRAKREHMIFPARTLPPPTAWGLRRSIDAALRWQGGQMEFQIHKHFLSQNRKMDGGEVNIMGQHGEIGRGFYTKRIRAWRLQPEAHEEALIRYCLRFSRGFMQPAVLEATREAIRTAFRQADHYGLTGMDRLDFFYLYERTRRWAPGGQYAQTGKVIAPFLNQDYIRAVYSLPPGRRRDAPFHNHLVRTFMPTWRREPYLEEIPADVLLKEYRVAVPRLPWLQRKRLKWKEWYREVRYPWVRKYREAGRRNYNNGVYWETVGARLAAASHASGMVWDASFIRTDKPDYWLEAPDDLVVLYLLQQMLASRS